MKTWKVAWPALGILATTLLISAAQGQTNVRVRGTITAVGSDSLSVKSRDGRDLKLELPADAKIVRAVPGTRADLIVGEYVFIGAQAAPDGTLRAPRIQVSKDGVKPPQ